mmetsp:Transcript_33576/g.64802  ORF Transcript_33576/g.64802 Transcript_33576/m.64802 type:complete len:123 (-) Transcript_33576:56-424(-)
MRERRFGKTNRTLRDAACSWTAARLSAAARPWRRLTALVAIAVFCSACARVRAGSRYTCSHAVARWHRKRVGLTHAAFRPWVLQDQLRTWRLPYKCIYVYFHGVAEWRFPLLTRRKEVAFTD